MAFGSTDAKDGVLIAPQKARTPVGDSGALQWGAATLGYLDVIQDSIPLLLGMIAAAKPAIQ